MEQFRLERSFSLSSERPSFFRLLLAITFQIANFRFPIANLPCCSMPIDNRQSTIGNDLFLTWCLLLRDCRSTWALALCGIRV
jgi:hypothetical protein